MAVTEQGVLDALKQVVDTNTGRDFVSTKAVRNVQIAQDAVSFDVELGYPAKSQWGALRAALTAAVQAVDGVKQVTVNLHTNIAAHAVQRGVQL